MNDAERNARADAAEEANRVAYMTADTKPNQLVVAVDLDILPARVVAEFMGSLDNLHRLYGGTGLRLTSTSGVVTEDGREVSVFILTGERGPLALVGEEMKKMLARINGG